MHHLQSKMSGEFLRNTKKLDEDKITDALNVLAILKEYEADVLTLAIPRYAKAQKKVWKNWKEGPRADIYVQPSELYKFASRALEFHRAESKLLIKKRTESKK